MEEELGQFERNEVQGLVPRPSNSNVIGTKWIFKNKIDEHGNITRNKARLVVQGYTQVEDVMKKDEMFEKSQGVIRISKKLHSGKHVDDVQEESSLKK